ncbi:MAG: hypothetical protein ACTSW1_10035 [Candidatus Hodarchaeales archaeon]
MDSFFINSIRKHFGYKFEENATIVEALTQTGDTNRALSVIGDCILDTVINHLAYQRNKDTTYLDACRKKYAEKKVNQAYLNFDVEFTRYLVEKGHTLSPVGGIGREKADRFYEAIIGAIYVEHGYDVARKHIIDILKTDQVFVEEFSEYIIEKRKCPICNIEYPVDEWKVEPIFEDMDSGGAWLDCWELTCPKGHKIRQEKI